MSESSESNGIPGIESVFSNGKSSVFVGKLGESGDYVFLFTNENGEETKFALTAEATCALVDVLLRVRPPA